MREFKTDRRRYKGEITAYLSLVFMLLLSFTAAMLESASIQLAKNYRRADMNRAVECVFAEYQKELLEQYDVFAIDGTYESGEYQEKNIYDRLTFYDAGDMEQDILRIQFLTDHGCRAFQEQAAAYMRHKYSLDEMEKFIGKTDIWKQQEQEGRDCEEEQKRQEEELAGLLEEQESELPSEDNPVACMETLKRTPVLHLVVPEGMEVSEKQLSLEETLSRRELNKGYGDFPETEKVDGTVAKLLFGEYVFEHFSIATDDEKTGVIDYQVEYILEGASGDKENLEKVARKLLLLRFGSNYIYLQTDGEKKAEAEAMALTLCSLLAVPAVTEAAAQLIFLAWAYGEAIVDIRSLLGGNHVPLVKNEQSWQLTLTSLLKLGTEEDSCDGKDTQGGLSYKEYLRILLFLKEKELTRIRTLDLIEQNLRTAWGQEYFRADACISKIEFSSTCRLRRGIIYRFPTYFGYH